MNASVVAAAAFLGTVALLTRTERRSPRGLTVAGIDEADLCRGCEGECGDLTQQPAYVREGYLWLGRYVMLLRLQLGDLEVVGWHRPPRCNERRDGAARSRHVAGWAVDLRTSPDQVARLVGILRRLGAIDERSRTVTARDSTGRRANAWGTYVRRALGWREGVGLRIYESGSLHIDLGCPPEAAAVCDGREDDWLEVLWRP